MSNDRFTPRAPAHVAPFVEVLGVEGAIAFLLEFGGAEMRMSAHATSRSRVAEFVGRQKARELARISARLPRRIPTARKWITAVLFARGLPKAEIARKLHVTDVTIRKWLRDGGSPGRSPSGKFAGPTQLSLF